MDALLLGVDAMKTNPLLATSFFVTSAVFSESTLRFLAKALELVGLLGLFASKFMTCLCSYSWFVSSAILLGRSILWNSQLITFLVLHAAVWFGKIVLLAALCSGHAG
jgi:hypothetical protein